MAIERITAVALPAPVARHTAQRPAPQGGDTVRLTVDATLLDDVLATLPDGQTLRLAGLGPHARHLSAGDVLLMRVLANGPRLELALVDTPLRGAASAGTPALASQAMQPDQLAQRQLSWRPPEAAALAHSWRSMVLSAYAPALAHARAQTTSTVARDLPAAARAAEALPVLREAGTLAAAPPPAAALTHAPLDRWLFPAYAWGGLHLMLRLVEPDDGPPPRPPRRRRGPLAVNLEVDVPGLGRVAVQVRLVAPGVQLVFFVEHEAALQPVRQALPSLSQTLLAADLRLVRCGVVRGLPGGRPVDEAAGRGLAAAQLLPPPLFRAAAEVAVALSAWVPPEGFHPVAGGGLAGA